MISHLAPSYKILLTLLTVSSIPKRLRHSGPRAYVPDVAHGLRRHVEVMRKPVAQARVMRLEELLQEYVDGCTRIQCACCWRHCSHRC